MAAPRMTATREWFERALATSSFETCLDHLLAAARATSGAVTVLARTVAWGSWRGGSTTVEPWPERLAGALPAEATSLMTIEDLDAGTVVLVPVLISTDPTAALAFVFERGHVLSADARVALEAFSQQARSVIGRARLLAELDRERRVWKLLGDVGGALASSLDYATTLERVVCLCVPEFADWAAVDLVNPTGMYERVAVACADPVKHSLAQQLKGRRYVPVPTGWGVTDVIAKAVPHLVPVFTDEMLQASARDPLHLAVMRALHVRSYVSAPLRVGDRVIGALSLGSCVRAYDQRDLEVGLELASRAARAIENARLFTIERRTARRLRSLQEATLGLSAAKTPSDIATVAARLGAEAVESESAAIWLLHDDRMLRLEAVHGVPATYLDDLACIPLEQETAVAQVVRSGEPRFVGTAAEYEEHAPAQYARAVSERRVLAHAMLPIISNDTAVGVMSFGYPLEHHFTSDEREYLRTFADATGQALERATLYVRETAAHGRAEVASRAKDEFLAMLGHELRNPLAPIVTALDLMKLSHGGRLGREGTVIERHVGHLTQLIDDLLDIARITRGAVVLRRQPTDVADAAHQAMEAVSVLFEDRVHAVRIDIEKGLSVDADRARLVQVLTNLLTNAAKYTRAGGTISLTARKRGEVAVVSVEDNGQGMSPALLSRVFDLFVQGERSADRTEGGLGLGLAIVKNLVCMHGGEVSVTSPGLGEGSTFTVLWPLARAIDASASRHRTPTLAPSAATGLKILVVDDNEDAAEMLGDLLRGRGHEVVVAHDGAAALATVADERPQLAILDIGLPVMDGYELAERIRELPELGGVHLIALTGFGQPADIERARRAGFDRHLVKPLDLALLDEILAGGN